MTPRQQHSRWVAALAFAGMPAFAACSGSSQAIEPADIDRPDVVVDVYEGAACDSIPEEVAARHALEAVPHSFDAEEDFDLDRGPHSPIYSSCAWAEGNPTIQDGFDERGGVEILVHLYGYSEPQAARGQFVSLRDARIWPEGTTEQDRLFGPPYEIAIGDHGFMQHREHRPGGDAGPAIGEAYALFTVDNAVAELWILHGIADPWSEDEMLAALSDMVAAFGM